MGRYMHWSHCPAGVGILIGDFNICLPEEGRFNVLTQTFSDGDLGRTAAFRSMFPTRPGDSAAKTTLVSSTFPRLKLVIFDARIRMIWEIGPYHATTLRFVSLSRNWALAPELAREVSCFLFDLEVSS